MKTLSNIVFAAALSAVLAASAVPAAARDADHGRDRGVSRVHDALCHPRICHTVWRYNALDHRVERVTECRCL